jgi:putative oxidoreductase
MSLISRTQDAYRSAARLAGLAQTPLLAAIRLYWGWQFAVTGWGKLHSLDRVTEFFGSLHLPMPGFTAVFVATVEFVGGVLLALGLGTRLVALALFINMSVAFWVADRGALLAAFSAPEKFYGADPFLFWAAALLLLIFGSGAWSVDRWLGVERLTD